jgi:hypothetical protein
MNKKKKDIKKRPLQNCIKENLAVYSASTFSPVFKKNWLMSILTQELDIIMGQNLKFGKVPGKIYIVMLKKRYKNG